MKDNTAIIVKDDNFATLAMLDILDKEDKGEIKVTYLTRWRSVLFMTRMMIVLYQLYYTLYYTSVKKCCLISSS